MVLACHAFGGFRCDEFLAILPGGDQPDPDLVGEPDGLYLCAGCTLDLAVDLCKKGDFGKMFSFPLASRRS